MQWDLVNYPALDGLGPEARVEALERSLAFLGRGMPDELRHVHALGKVGHRVGAGLLVLQRWDIGRDG